MEVSENLGNLLFAKPASIGNRTIDDMTLSPGSYSFSGTQANGLTSYSGILYVETLTGVRYLISKDTMAYKRTDGNWYKVTAVEQK